MNDTLVCLNLLSMNGCDSLHCYQLSFRDTFLQLQSIVLCEGESVVVGNNTYTQAGVYTDVFTNQFNCDSTIRTELIIRPLLHLFFDEESLLLSPGDSVQLRPQSNFAIDTFFWISSSADFCQTCLEPFVSPRQTTSYTITASDENGCSATAVIEVLIDLKLPVYLPNAFSPNDDGINDYFLPLGGQQLVLIRRLQVFDRWGGLLYDQTDLPPNGNSGWDGRANGRPLQAGVYVYLAEVELIDGSTTLLSGEVLLVR